jgi:hypothetical protein
MGSVLLEGNMMASVVHRRLELFIITPTSKFLCLRELVKFWFPMRQYLRPTKEFIKEHTLKHVTNKRRREYFGGSAHD